MKKIEAVIVVLVVSLALPIAGSAQTTIDKMMPSDANLGDVLTVTIDVNNTDVNNITVQDFLPGSLELIPGTFEIDDMPATPVVNKNTITTEVGTGVHQIVFEVQVVEVEADDVDVINFARVLNIEGVEEANDVAIVKLYPYEGFVKEIIDWGGTTDPCATSTYVPIHTDIHWLILIEVANIADDAIEVMGDAVVKDRLGGDLELDDINDVTAGTVDISKKKGKTQKQFITWEIGDVNDANDAQLVIEISTDVNPGQSKKTEPKNEYTSPGIHCLNSGAVLKFVDVQGTGFKLSAHTPEIRVEAYVPENNLAPMDN